MGINAVTCNCIDTSTGSFSGKGINHDQYLEARTILNKCYGEFWGITKTSLLGNLRFNEKLPGMEGTVWTRIDIKAKRYYLHRALRLYHTEGDDRVTKIKRRYDVEKWSRAYRVLIEEETDYLQIVKSLSPSRYQRWMFNAFRAFTLAKDRTYSQYAYSELKSSGHSKLFFLAWPGTFAGRHWIKTLNWAHEFATGVRSS